MKLPSLYYNYVIDIRLTLSLLHITVINNTRRYMFMSRFNRTAHARKSKNNVQSIKWSVRTDQDIERNSIEELNGI